jgi:hypothetical protein
MTRIRKINKDTQSIGVDHFFDMFSKEKRRYPPSFFCISKPSKLKRKKPIDHILYRKIILEYLKLYFFDFYLKKGALYFPLGGFLKKVLYPKWSRFQARGSSKKQISGTEGSIGLFWYMRPSSRMYYMVKIKKLTGSSNRLPKLESRFKNIINKDLIPIFKPELSRKKENKTLYICTLTSSPLKKSSNS